MALLLLLNVCSEIEVNLGYIRTCYIESVTAVLVPVTGCERIRKFYEKGHFDM